MSSPTDGVIDLPSRVKIRSLEDRNATLTATNTELVQQVRDLVAAGGGLGIAARAHRPRGGVGDIDPPGVGSGARCGDATPQGFCPRVEVDVEARLVRCCDCGAVIDPISVLIDYANLDRRLLAQTQAARDAQTALRVEISDLKRQRDNLRRSVTRAGRQA